MSVRVFQVPSPKHYADRRGQAVIALVHHRMVGTLKSTDTTFTTGTREASTNFGVGYNCGRSGHPVGIGGAHVHQYVAVDQAAWGNGNLDLTGSWDNVYGATPNPNYRTISIEHHDNGGLPLGEGRGVVPPEVRAVSIALDRLLLSGDWVAWKAAGIRATTDSKGAAIAAQCKRIIPSSKTIIDHNYIAGRLKPFCWKPWADDRVGFPQALYLAALTAPVPVPPDTSTGAIDVPLLSSYIPGQVATVKVNSNIRSAPVIAGNTPIRRLTAPETWVVTGWVKGALDPESGSDQWVCRWAGGRWEYTAKVNLSAGPAVPPNPLQATVTALTNRIAAIKAKVAAGASDIADD